MNKNLRILVVAVFSMLGIYLFPSRSRNDTQSVARDENRNYLIGFVKKHPDPKISEEMYSLWESGQFWVLEENLPPGAGGTFERLTTDSGEIQPTLVLSSAKIEMSKTDDLSARSLMKTIRHEYEHYLQWKQGKFFQKNLNETDLVTRCREVWEREFPVYRDDCYRTERWWPGQPSIFPDGRCQYKADEKQFGQIVASLLSDVEPRCSQIWHQTLEETH